VVLLYSIFLLCLPKERYGLNSAELSLLLVSEVRLVPVQDLLLILAHAGDICTFCPKILTQGVS
jgi:hypothetical protein